MDSGKALLIRVTNIPQLVQKQGAAASFAQMLAPSTVEDKALNTIKDGITSSFKEKGVSADVTIVSASGFQPTFGSLWRPVALGVLGMALTGFITYRIAKRK